MSRPQALLAWLEDTSDWLSPLVVKEVRQVVRGREFNYSFGGALAAGLAVAFFGAADALTGSGTSGRWTFYALMGCMAFLGLGVVPLGAFSALRNERMEQTLELITLTALSPRRVVIGKLLAQSVKLATLFAAMAPFLAMSFLLGGIDFVTILLSLAVVFMWSLWACAVCLFSVDPAQVARDVGGGLRRRGRGAVRDLRPRPRHVHVLCAARSSGRRRLAAPWGTCGGRWPSPPRSAWRRWSTWCCSPRTGCRCRPKTG